MTCPRSDTNPESQEAKSPPFPKILNRLNILCDLPDKNVLDLKSARARRKVGNMEPLKVMVIKE